MLKEIITLTGALYLGTILSPVLAGTGHSSQRSLPTETTLEVTAPEHSSIIAKSIAIAICDDKQVLFVPTALVIDQADNACSKYAESFEQIVASSGYVNIPQITDRLNQLEIAAALSITQALTSSKK